MKELKVLFPETKLETSQGEVEIKPFVLRDFDVVVGIIDKYLSTFVTAIALNREGQIELESGQAVSGREAAVNVFIENLLGKSNEGYQLLDDLLTLLSLSSNWEKEQFLEFPYPEAISLLLEVIEANKVFFSQVFQSSPVQEIQAQMEQPTGEQS